MSSKGRFSGCALEALKLSFVTLVVLFIGFLSYEDRTDEEKAENKAIFTDMTGFG